MLDHLRACPHCPKYGGSYGECTAYQNLRMASLYGCPLFPYREIPRLRGEYLDGKIVSGVHRPGQQKQKKADRTYNNAKSKRKFRR